MLDHFGFVVTNLETSASFFEHCLAPLGLKIIERHDYGAVIFARSKTDEVPFIWIGTARPGFWSPSHAASKSPIHLCFKAPSKKAVEYVAALGGGALVLQPEEHRRPEARARG